MKVYLSHSIRGKSGASATHTEMEENCQTAILIANILRVQFPKVDFYVPGEHEAFVQRAWNKGYLTERQILEIDCLIISSCDAVIIYVPEGDSLQGGREIECNYADKHHIPVFIFAAVDHASKWINSLILRG